MSQDEFTKLYRLMLDMQSSMATKDDITELQTGLGQIRDILDKHTDMLDTDELERLALAAQVSRHESWIAAAASKVGAKYA